MYYVCVQCIYELEFEFIWAYFHVHFSVCFSNVRCDFQLLFGLGSGRETMALATMAREQNTNCALLQNALWTQHWDFSMTIFCCFGISCCYSFDWKIREFHAKQLYEFDDTSVVNRLLFFGYFQNIWIHSKKSSYFPWEGNVMHQKSKCLRSS